MIHDRRSFAGVRRTVLGLSLAAWAVMFTGLPGHGHEALKALCSTAALPWLRLDWVLSCLSAWLPMLAAMMLPLTLPTLAYVWRESLVRRRRRALALCLGAYVAVWLLVGLAIEALAMLLDSLETPGWMAASMAAGGLLAWQCSPFKQYCLNRCHSHPPLSAFGLRADLDAARLGFSHGAWCAGSCWALMAATMYLPHAHVLAMVVATVVLYGERLEPPARPGWRLRIWGTAQRLLQRQALMLSRVAAGPLLAALAKRGTRRSS